MTESDLNRHGLMRRLCLSTSASVFLSQRKRKAFDHRRLCRPSPAPSKANIYYYAGIPLVVPKQTTSVPGLDTECFPKFMLRCQFDGIWRWAFRRQSGYKGGPPQPVSEISAFLRTDPGALKPWDIRDQPPVNQQEPSPGKTPLAP